MDTRSRARKVEDVRLAFESMRFQLDIELDNDRPSPLSLQGMASLAAVAVQVVEDGPVPIHPELRASVQLPSTM